MVRSDMVVVGVIAAFFYRHKAILHAKGIVNSGLASSMGLGMLVGAMLFKENVVESNVLYYGHAVVDLMVSLKSPPSMMSWQCKKVSFKGFAWRNWGC